MLRSWFESFRVRIGRQPQSRRRGIEQRVSSLAHQAESLEPRSLPTVTGFMLLPTELTVLMEQSDSVQIGADTSGNVQVVSGTTTINSFPTIATNLLTKLTVIGADGNNSIDISGVNSGAQFLNTLIISVHGGDGNDTLIGGDLADSLNGDDGADSILGNEGNDTLDGSDGLDTVLGGDDNDSLLGGDGMDSLSGEAGDDTIIGGNGADNASGGVGTDSLSGGDGADTLAGNDGDDFLNGEDGFDSLLGGNGNDSMLGGAENDTLSGDDGNDTINANAGNDIVTGDAGLDNIEGGDGNDSISGGTDNDTISAGIGNDTVLGNDGSDSILGGGGNDSIVGGTDNDTVLGQSGNDTLIGGGGVDLLDGGDGNDLVQSGVPTLFINDFSITEPDVSNAVVTFTVVLSAASTSTVTVDYETAIGTATEGVDYTRVANRLTFAPNVISQTITVAITGDLTVEPDETFVVNLTNATNALIGDSQGLATIVDNDLTSSFGVPIVNQPGQSGGARPPDTVGDVGLNHYVQAVNAAGGSRIQIFDKLGAPIGGTFLLSSLAPAGASVAGRGDPCVEYDQMADRWLLTEFSAGGVGTTNEIYMYVSRTGTPTNNPADWFFYEFTAPQFPDYLKFGVWPDGYYMSSNESVPAVYVFDRTNMLLGLPAQPFQRFTGPALAGFGFQAFTPVDLDGFTAPAGGNPAYFVRHRDDEAHNVGSNNPTQDFVELWQLDVDFVTPANSSFTQVGANIPISEFDSDINGLFAFSGITQPAPGPSLDPLREVIMFRSFYRNFGTHESIVGNFVTDTNGLDLTGVRWFELRRVGGGTWSTFQEGTIAPDADNRWMGAIAMNGNGEIAVAYNVASATTLPGLRYTGRRAADPLGTMPNGENLIFNGTGISPTNRWGDYAAMSVDPADDRTFWFTGEFATGGNFGTRVTSFAFPSPAATGATAFPSLVDLGDLLVGGNGNDTILGADGNDTINGMAGNDSLDGGAGNDSMLGGAGFDTLDGGAGDDTLDAQGGNDVIRGGDGSDTYVWNGAGDGVDTLSSLSGYDRVRVQGTNDATAYTVSQVNRQIRISDGTAAINISPIIQVIDINAGAGNDLVTITALDQIRTGTILTVNGDLGNDTMTATGVNMGFVRLRFNGGEGEDSLTGSNGNDTLDGGNGVDRLDGGAGNDSLTGGGDNDRLLGGIGNDRISGGDANDSISGNDGNDILFGDDGADTIDGNTGNDTIDGGIGTDTLLGSEGADSINGGNEADYITGSSGNDTLIGGASGDTILGETGNDELFGSDGDDSLLGGDGNDTINGGDGDDTINGELGDDLASGGHGDDAVNGGAGSDTLLGCDGADTILGGSGNDVLFGEEGDDSLNGQGGTDTINAGEGVDTVNDATSVIDLTFALPASLLNELENC